MSTNPDIPCCLLQALREYYNSNTLRSRSGRAISFRATAKILDGRQASYNSQDPFVASYSSRGPDVNNALLDTADVLKPNIMAPGSSIWASWSPNSEGDQHIKGMNFTNSAYFTHLNNATHELSNINLIFWYLKVWRLRIRVESW